MARFYGGVHGNRGEATRLGTKGSGLTAFAQGWNIGVNINCWVASDGEDRVTVYISGGSNGRGSTRPLGTFKKVNGEIVREGE